MAARLPGRRTGDDSVVPPGCRPAPREVSYRLWDMGFEAGIWHFFRTSTAAPGSHRKPCCLPCCRPCCRPCSPGEPGSRRWFLGDAPVPRARRSHGPRSGRRSPAFAARGSATTRPSAKNQRHLIVLRVEARPRGAPTSLATTIVTALLGQLLPSRGARSGRPRPRQPRPRNPTRKRPTARAAPRPRPASRSGLAGQRQHRPRGAPAAARFSFAGAPRGVRACRRTRARRPENRRTGRRHHDHVGQRRRRRQPRRARGRRRSRCRRGLRRRRGVASATGPAISVTAAPPRAAGRLRQREPHLAGRAVAEKKRTSSIGSRRGTRGHDDPGGLAKVAGACPHAAGSARPTGTGQPTTPICCCAAARISAGSMSRPSPTPSATRGRRDRDRRLAKANRRPGDRAGGRGSPG